MDLSSDLTWPIGIAKPPIGFAMPSTTTILGLISWGRSYRRIVRCFIVLIEKKNIVKRKTLFLFLVFIQNPKMNHRENHHQSILFNRCINSIDIDATTLPSLSSGSCYWYCQISTRYSLVGLHKRGGYSTHLRGHISASECPFELAPSAIRVEDTCFLSFSGLKRGQGAS